MDKTHMPTLLVKNIEYLATFDDARREIRDGALFVRDNVIEHVGTTAQLGAMAADRVLDLSGHVVMPGMVNTHHHMYQNLTRVMVQDDELFVWLTTLYPIWAELDDDAIYVSARVAMAELMQSGCTTSSDHLYVLPITPRSTPKSARPGKSASAFTQRAAPCRAAKARADCRRTIVSRKRMLFCAMRNG
jgi:cytosine/adenosine deaminase-related metal-dependent hydrolase